MQVKAAVIKSDVRRLVAADLLKVLAAVAALALSARVALPLPGSPVPLTLQTLAVMLVGAALGRQLGVMAVAGYLAAGLCGLPVFTAGGGPGYLLTPTAGYLIGFLPAAWLAGLVYDRARGWTALPAMLLADAAIFACGLAVLALYLPAAALLPIGLLSFLPGEAIKILLGAVALNCRRR